MCRGLHDKSEQVRQHEFINLPLLVKHVENAVMEQL